MVKDIFEKVKNILDRCRWTTVFLLAIPFFNDVYTGYQIIPDWIMDYLKIAVFVLLVILQFRKKKGVSPLLMILIAYEGWWLATTVINFSLGDTEMYHKLICDIVNALSMGFIIEYFMDDPKELVKGLILNFELSIYPNFVTVILKNVPGDRYYLLGFYAVLILWIMPAICVSALYMLLYRKYIRGAALITISLATIVMVNCATETVAFLGMTGVILLGLLLFRIKDFRNIKLPLSAFLILALLLNCFILFVYNGGSFPLINVFIEKFLNRSTTFTNRTLIWEKALASIAEKPIIGHGYRPVLTLDIGFQAVHTHNQILQVLNVRGVIGLLLFAAFHVVLCVKVDRSRNTFARLLTVGACFGIFLTYITEAYKKFFRLYLVFFIAYHIDQLIMDRLSDKDALLK